MIEWCYVNKYCGLPLFFSKMLVANTVVVVYGVQNWSRCHCKAHFIKKVKLQKQQLRCLIKKVKKVKIFKKYLWQSSHFQNVAGSKNETFHGHFIRINSLKKFLSFLKAQSSYGYCLFVWVLLNFVPEVFFKSNEFKNSSGKFDINP